MSLEANVEFVCATEALVNNTDQRCFNCGTPIMIVGGLLKCEGSCGYGACLSIDLPEIDTELLDKAAMRIGRAMARTQAEMMGVIIQ